MATDIDIHHVEFNETGVEVIYQEARDKGPEGGIQWVRTCVIPRGVADREINMMLETIQDLVDRAHEIHVGTPDRLER